MTSVAFIIGVVPLVLSEGAGSEMRQSLGTAVFAGMVGVTLFGIFLTPVFFVTISRLTDWWSGGKASTEPEGDPVVDPEHDASRNGVAHGGHL